MLQGLLQPFRKIYITAFVRNMKEFGGVLQDAIFHSLFAVTMKYHEGHILLKDLEKKMLSGTYNCSVPGNLL